MRTTRSHNLDRAAARVEAQQHGVITRQQLFDLGFTDRMIRTRLRNGRYRRLARGIYAALGAPDTLEQRQWAALLDVGPDAALSHGSAGFRWNVPNCRRPTGLPEVLVPHDHHGHRSQLAVVHRSRRLQPSDITTVDGLRITTPARTLVDLASTTPVTKAGVDRLTTQVDDVICRRVVDVVQLRRVFDSVCGQGRPGTVILRRILNDWDPTASPESPPEAAFDRWMREEGLGGIAQYVIDAGGRSLRVDRAWPDARLVVEVNSYRWHGTPSGHQATADRAAMLRALRWEVQEVTPPQIARRDPNVARAIRHALSRRGPQARSA